MKKNIIYLITIVLSAIFCACNQKMKIDENEILKPGDVEVINLKALPHDPHIDIVPLLDTVRFVQLELTDESVIGYIQKIRLYKDRIYVLDTQTSSLLAFNIDGEYLFKIANVGKGPGEYTQLDFFDIDTKNEQIVLTDLMGYWVMRYDMEGHFICRRKIPFWVEGLVPNYDQGVVVYCNFRDNKTKLNQEYNLMYLDSLMTVQKAYFSYNSTVIQRMNVKFATPRTGVFYPYKDDFFLLSPQGNEVYKVEKEGLVPVYKFDFGEQSFKPHWLDDPEKGKSFIKEKNYFFFFTSSVHSTPTMVMSRSEHHRSVAYS
jgi:hypothetical protein